MIGLEGWSPSGPPIDGPGAVLHPVRDRAGAPHLALQFGPELARHPLLRQGMDPIAPFVRDPAVTGVAPLVAWDREHGTFVYPSGDGVLVARILEHCRVQRRPPGVRAALELLMAVGPVLDDAARAGRRAGLPGHGALNPWRILVHPTGGASLLGHGVPAVEVASWLEASSPADGISPGPGPGLAYFAPERIDEEDEDLRADLYALAATAAEVALGRPLLSGNASPRALAEQIRTGGAAAALVAEAEPGWPSDLVRLLKQALAVDRAERPASGRSMAARAGELLLGSSGASLYDLAAVLGLPGGTEPVDDEPSVSTVVPKPSPAPEPPPKPEPEPEPEPPPKPEPTAKPEPPPTLEPEPLEPTVRAPRSVAPTARPRSVPPPKPPPLTTAPVSLPPSRPPASVPPPKAPVVATARSRALSSDEDVVLTDVIMLDDLLKDPPILPPPSSEKSATPADLRSLRVHGSRPPGLPQTPPSQDLPPPIAPVEDLPRDAPLADIQEQARRIVVRTREVAERAVALCATVAERGGTDPNQATVVRIARQSADRATRAAESAKSAAGLIELDEDASGALITLDLVRNAELQCEGALADVSTQLKELERVAERIQAQTRALADAARRALDHANRATDAANQADDLVTSLEQEQRDGRLSADGVVLGIDAAIASAERAHAAAEEARANAELARSANRADLALRHAEVSRRAEDAALAGLQETREAAGRARKAELDAKIAAVDRAADRLVAGRLAEEEAGQALQRADEALKVATTAESRRLREQCEAAVNDARTAANEAEEAHTAAQRSGSARDAVGQAQQAEEYAIHAAAAALQAKVTSDRIVTLAGELAEAHARLSKLQEEARGLVERSRAGVGRVREEVDRLNDEAGRLTGAEVTSHRTEATVAIRTAEEALARMERPAGLASTGTEAQVVVTLLDELRTLAAGVTRATEEAREQIAVARAAAEAELSELRRMDEARKAVAVTATEAALHAKKCRELVDQAWRIARNLSPALLATEVDEAVRLRTKALEIIDIAEYQAGEATSSADLAAAETDPAEARAHAQTAQSFMERITADLPEAIDGLAAADGIARREVEALATARARTAEVTALLEQTRADAQAQVAALRTEASAWSSDESVAAQLVAVEQAALAFEEDVTEAGWARDRAATAKNASEASEYVPNAESALGRARDKKRRLDALADTVRRAISAAEAAAGTVQDARRTTRGHVEGVASDLTRLVAAQRRLKSAIVDHGAAGEAVVNAELRLREAVDEVRRFHVELSTLAEQANHTRSAEEARLLAGRTTELLRSVERTVEIAAEAEAKGIAAAEHESRARNEAHHQRLLVFREDAAAHARRAREQVERVDAALQDVESQGATGGEFARQRLEEVARLAELVRSQVGDLEKAAADAGVAEDAAVVEGLTEKARALAERITSETTRVMIVVQEALDLARAAAVEAEALRSVRNEVGSAGEKADEAVERARAEAARIPSVVRDAPHIDVAGLTEEAGQHVQAAAKAAAKVRAAIPLTAQADALPVAQSILRTARMALERANASADAVRALIDRVLDQIRHEKESASRALSDARARAAQPAQEAAAAARKAEGWLEAGKREVGELAAADMPRASLDLLERTVAEVRKLAEQAAAKAAGTESAETIAAAEAMAPAIRKAADATVEASERARAALGAVRERIATARAENEAAAAVAAEAAEQAAAASQVAEQGEATLRELEQIVDSAVGMDDGVMRALESVRTAATNARFAAATAGQAAERARSVKVRTDAERAAEAAHSALEDALDALEKVVEAEQVCRQAIETSKSATAAQALQGETDRRNQAQEKSRQQAQLEQAESDERRRREEERKSNVERRREERRPTEGLRATAASDRETLREMLRKSRPTIEVQGDLAARPRRRGDNYEERNETQPGFSSMDATSPGANGATLKAGSPATGPSPDPTSGRNVRKWTPSQKSATAAHPTTPPRSGRPTAARPATVKPPTRPQPQVEEPVGDPDTEPKDQNAPPTLGRTSDSPKVDALLERLRARRTDKD